MINSTPVQWVVQKNLTNYNDFSALENACRELRIPFVGVKVIPFSNELPDFYRMPKNVFYGSTTLFIRPDDDGKSFAGEVLRFAEYREWFERLMAIENAGISGKTRIVVGDPFHIGREWRLWCVDKKVIAASQYRNNFKLEKLRDCPSEVVSFAEARCLQFTPHDVFVMDVCETGGELYIVECNCMNAAGFYDADIEAIVSNVTNYLLSRAGQPLS